MAYQHSQWDSTEYPSAVQSSADQSLHEATDVQHGRVLSSSSTADQQHPFIGLFDCPDVVFERLSQGKKLSKEVRSFYQELAAIEQTYAKSVLKLCGHTTFTASDSLQNSLAGMIRFVEDSARLRSEWATTLSTGMCESMSNLADELKKQKNQMSVAYGDVKKKLRLQSQACDKAHTRYAQASKDVEREVGLRKDIIERGGTTKQIVKQEKRVRDAVKFYLNKKQAYADCIEQHHAAQDSFEKSVDYILKNIEAIDLGRIRSMQTSLSQLHSSTQSLHQNLETPSQLLMNSVDNILPLRDLELFVQSKYTGGEKAPRRAFVEVYSDIVNREVEAVNGVASPVKPQASSKLMQHLQDIPETTWNNHHNTGVDIRSSSTPSRRSTVDSSDPTSNMMSSTWTATPAQGSSSSLHHVLAALNVGAERPEDHVSAPNHTLNHAQVKAEESVAGEPSPSFVRTVFEFDDESDECLTFGVGEFIMVKETVDDDWCRGILGGREGLFPTSFVENHTAMLASVIYDYSSTSEAELSLSTGQTCYVLDDSDVHWFWACDADGRQGNYPRAYCELLSNRS